MTDLVRDREQVRLDELDAHERLRRREPTEVLGDLVEAGGRIVDQDGVPLAVSVALGPVGEDLRETLLRLRRYQEGIRSGGMPTRSRTFGFHPRYALKTTEFCGPCSCNYEEPDVYSGLVDFAQVACDLYRQARPAVYAHEVSIAEQEVLPEYRIAGPFTSGIVNHTNPLTYHRDGGNRRGSWNVMAVVRSGVVGGHLHVPAFDATFRCDDGVAILFDAGATTHGVTPMRKRSRHGYRLSVVYFALRQMAGCLPHAEELAWSQRKRTEREERRAGLRD